MKELFEQKLVEFYTQFGDSKLMVLSSACNDRVSSRMMSVVRVDGRFYFQTDKNFRKCKQIKSNPNIALCVDNIQIEGVCKEIGKPVDNADFIELFKRNYQSSCDRYSHLENEVLFEIIPNYIQRWLYIDEVSYIEKFEFSKQSYTIERYDVDDYQY